MTQQRPRTQLDFPASCERLREIGVLFPGEAPVLPEAMPSYDDDDPLGVSFLRSGAEGLDFSNLTMPRTYMGRSSFTACSFVNTDLAESRICWNEFQDVDFTRAILARADLRASRFEGVTFVEADLRGADLRWSSFSGCRFDDALLGGAVLSRTQDLELSAAQASQVDWRHDEGPEPPGG